MSLEGPQRRPFRELAVNELQKVQSRHQEMEWLLALGLSRALARRGLSATVEDPSTHRSLPALRLDPPDSPPLHRAAEHGDKGGRA